MRSRSVILSAVATTSLVACAGFLVATRSPAGTDRAPPDPTTTDVSLARPVVAPPVAERHRGVDPRATRSSRENGYSENGLGISTTDLMTARELADEMAADMEHNLSTMQDAGYGRDSRAIESPSRMLGLRLGVDAEISEKLGEILAADRAHEIERRIAAEKARLERTRELLERNRDNYVSYLALESMLSRGVPISEAQEAFYKQFRQTQEPGKASEAGPVNQEWYEKPHVLDAMHRHLSPEQQAELVKFVDERKSREQERQTMHAFMRSGAIADRLGLDEGERTTLYEYLLENPDASSPELSEILAPELRELLPAGL